MKNKFEQFTEGAGEQDDAIETVELGHNELLDLVETYEKFGVKKLLGC